MDDTFSMNGHNPIINGAEVVEESSVLCRMSVTSHHQEEEEIMFQSTTMSMMESKETDKFFVELDDNILLTSTPNLVSKKDNVDSFNDSAESSYAGGNGASSYDGMKGLVKRVTLLQSFSLGRSHKEDELQTDTLENHLFPDLSFSQSDVFYDDSQFKTFNSSGDTTWNKLHGISYSPCRHRLSTADEVDTDRSINHANRSRFRQKKRNWYLNRRTLGSQRKEKRKTSLSYISKFFHILFVIYKVMHQRILLIRRKVEVKYYYISKHLSTYKYVIMPILSIFSFPWSIFLLPWYVYVFTKRMIRSVISKLFSAACCYYFCWALFVTAALLAILCLNIDEGSRKMIPNPVASGIDNANSIYIVEGHMEIHAWHIYPKPTKLSSLHPIKVSLRETSPVIMFLRNEGNVATPQLKSMYETLFSLGYHIIVPTDIISQPDILKTWQWIRRQTNATAYMWGFGMNATMLSDTAKVFCKHFMPPNGVIIAKEVKSENLPRTMEIWSCNCALSKGESASTFKYNHVKCSIAFDNTSNDVYSQIVACIETVNKKVHN